MHSIFESAKLTLLQFERENATSTALVTTNAVAKRAGDTVHISVSFFVTILLPFLTLLYLELARTQSRVVQAPIRLKTLPNLICTGHIRDDKTPIPMPLEKLVQKAEPKVEWLAIAGKVDIISTNNTGKLQICVPSAAELVRRRGRAALKHKDEIYSYQEECLKQLIEETLAHFRVCRPYTREFKLLLPKLERVAATWNSIMADFK